VIGTSFDAGTKSFTVLVVRSLSAILSTDELSLSAAVTLVWIGACFGFGSVLGSVVVLRVSGSGSEGVLNVGSVFGSGSEGVLRVFGSSLRAGVTVAVAGVGRRNLREVCIVHSASLSMLMSFIK